jgi:hypothetical protein
VVWDAPERGGITGCHDRTPRWPHKVPVRGRPRRHPPDGHHLAYGVPYHYDHRRTSASTKPLCSTILIANILQRTSPCAHRVSRVTTVLHTSSTTRTVVADGESQSVSSDVILIHGTIVAYIMTHVCLCILNDGGATSLSSRKTTMRRYQRGLLPVSAP